jgi:hypothetical protein
MDEYERLLKAECQLVFLYHAEVVNLDGYGDSYEEALKQIDQYIEQLERVE